LISGEVLLDPFEIALRLGLWNILMVEQLVLDLEVIKSLSDVSWENFVALSGISMTTFLIWGNLSYKVDGDVCSKVLCNSLNGSGTTESSADLPLLSWDNIGYVREFGVGRTANTWSDAALVGFNHIRVCDFHFIIHKHLLG